MKFILQSHYIGLNLLAKTKNWKENVEFEIRKNICLHYHVEDSFSEDKNVMERIMTVIVIHDQKQQFNGDYTLVEREEEAGKTSYYLAKCSRLAELEWTLTSGIFNLDQSKPNGSFETDLGVLVDMCSIKCYQ